MSHQDILIALRGGWGTSYRSDGLDAISYLLWKRKHNKRINSTTYIYRVSYTSFNPQVNMELW